jgi:catechol 2,3-dioxygenase-like lactoylglutathione lyase family enzyme
MQHESTDKPARLSGPVIASCWILRYDISSKTKMTELGFRTKLGHAHLKVRDLDRAIEFYTRFLRGCLKSVIASAVCEAISAFCAILRLPRRTKRSSQRHLSLHLVERIGNEYAFPPVGNFLHEVALQNVGADAAATASNGIALYHIAFEVPDREPGGKELWHGVNFLLGPDKILQARDMV